MYDPYFTIPGTMDFFGRLWRTAWKGKGKSGFKRVTAIMMIVLFWWPFFLIGLPWLLKRRRMNNDSRIDS